MARNCMEYVERMNLMQRRAVLNGKPWTEAQRIYYKHGILSAQRSRMEDDDPRKNGIMLKRRLDKMGDRVIYYVDGGVYETLGGKFALVKPGGDNSKPYVYASETQSGMTEHHSHHYELSEDMRTVKLVKESWVASEGFPGGVSAPAEATLSESDLQGVKERISTGDIY